MTTPHLYTVRPVTGRMINRTQRVHGVGRVYLGIGHEKAGLLQSVAERVHFRVDEQRKKMLYCYVVRLALDAQRFGETFHV